VKKPKTAGGNRQKLASGKKPGRLGDNCVCPLFESPTSRGAGGLDFSAIGGKIQRHRGALIGASNTV